MEKEVKNVLENLKKADKPLKTGDLVELSRLGKDVVAKAIKTLKAEGLIDSPKRCFYQAKK